MNDKYDREKKSSKKSIHSAGEEVVWEVQALDVLMGRESLDSYHTGTVRLLTAIDASIPEYSRFTGRADKTRLIKDIYHNAASQGRFLTRHDSIPNAYKELSERAAREKISHIIRYRQRNTAAKSEAGTPVAPTPPAVTEAAASESYPSAGSSSSFETNTFGLDDAALTLPLHIQEQNVSIYQPTQPSPFLVSEGEEIAFWVNYYSQEQQQQRHVDSMPTQPPLLATAPSAEIEEIFSDAELLSVLGNIFDPD